MTLAASILLTASVLLGAQQQVPWTNGGPLKADSSNFVTASLLIIEPGPKAVSAMGHSAIRLECPVHNLDYCFTLENNPEYSLLSFILGQTPTHDIAIPTAQFLQEFKNEGRKTTQHQLNLTLHEKQKLWQLADLEFVNDGDRLFNYSYDGTDNCTSICLELIEDALINEELVVDKMPPILTENNATYLKHVARRSPWVQFMLITLAGTGCDETWNMRNRMAPEMIIPVLEKSHFKGDSSDRPALIGDPKELVKGKVNITPITASPLVVFSCLLIITLVISIAQLLGHGNKIAKWLDVALFSIQTLVAVFLLVTVVVGTIVGKHWNWYLIPFNLLPLIIWLLWRKRKGFYKVYLFYTIVLVLFILATPLSAQLDLPHQLITATLAARCVTKYLINRKTLFNHK